MSTVAERNAGGPDLFRSASEDVAFGSVEAQLAAEAAAAGSVGAAEKLSERDKRMLAIGTLAGAAAAIARARFPFESGTDTLERTDAALEHARAIEARNLDGLPLFAEGGA